MPRVNRSEIFADNEVQVFHCISRCVRRTMLCGVDRRTRRDFSHRKEWIRERLEFLAGAFGIEVLSFAVMSNHMHVVLRTRPDVVRGWSDEEVALRWWRLCPGRRDEDGRPSDPTEPELHQLLNDTVGMAERRRRLSSVSWFLKLLTERIAKRGNLEEKVTGHFWEGRAKIQPLLDETAIAACMAYVDLNPIRAGVASTPEASDYTSVQARILDRSDAMGAVSPCAASVNSVSGVDEPSAVDSAVVADNSPERTVVAGDGAETGRIGCDRDSGGSAVVSEIARRRVEGSVTSEPQVTETSLTVSREDGRRSGWLAPIELARSAAEETTGMPAARRASHRGCLSMTLDQYLSLLDWTGRQIRQDKTGSIPQECAPILERLSCSSESWLDLVKHFRKRFRTEAGLASTLAPTRNRRLPHSAAVNPA